MRTKTKAKTDNNLFETAKARTSDIETVKQNDIEYYTNRVYDAIEEYKRINDIDSITSLKQLQYNAVLMYIGKTVFSYNKKRILDYRNIELLNQLLDLYINICATYNKTISIIGYSHFIYMDYTVLYKWEHNLNRDTIYYDTTNNMIIDSKAVTLYRIQHNDVNIVELPNTQYSLLVKKIKQIREGNLKDKTEDGSIPSLALGKIEYGWIEGKDNQLKAQVLEQYIQPSNLLEKYND